MMAIDNRITFQQLLRGVLRETEATQKDLARCLGVSPGYVNDLLHGKRKPSVVITKKICNYLGRAKLGRLVWMTAGARASGWEL